MIRADEVESEIDNLDLTELAHRGIDDLQKRAETLQTRYSISVVRRETAAIERTSKLSTDISRISLSTLATLPHTSAQLDNTSCVQSNDTTRFDREKLMLTMRLNDWLAGMQSLRPGPVDEETSRMWHERARSISHEISSIDLSPTKTWANELMGQSKQLEDQLKKINERVKASDFKPQIDRLKHYQKEQGDHLDGQEKQLYHMGNATEDGLKKVKEAQVKEYFVTKKCQSQI